MFICSVRASTLKFLGVIALAIGVLVTLIALTPPYNVAASGEAMSHSASYSDVKTNEDRVKFLSQFGWEVKSEPVGMNELSIPAEFDRVIAGYNEIQKKQGFDLSRYTKKTVTRYTYEVLNYPGAEGVVYVNIMLYKNRVIAGDVCAADGSFIHGLEGN